MSQSTPGQQPLEQQLQANIMQQLSMFAQMQGAGQVSAVGRANEPMFQQSSTVPHLFLVLAGRWHQCVPPQPLGLCIGRSG
jgi:hypothetical protein